MFTESNFMGWFFVSVEVCCGLVLGLFSHYLLSVDLGLPAPEVLGQQIKTELMSYLDILTTHLVPALSFALIIRKLTS
jgi:hypothetical protein